MIKAIVFDLDDTLLDFMTLKRKCIEASVDGMLRAGLPVPKDKAIDAIFKLYGKDGMEDQAIFDKFLTQELGHIDYKIMAAAIVNYRRMKKQIAPYPGVVMTLTELLKLGIKLAVLTDAPKIQAWTRLTESHLENYFAEVVALEDTGKKKPHPDPFKLMISKLCIPAENILMTGDRIEKDMLGARSAGMLTGFVEYNKSVVPEYTMEENDLIDFKLSTFKDLLGIVSKK